VSTCPHCTAEFDPPRRGRPKVYCSDTCRRAAQNLRRCPDPQRRRPRQAGQRAKAPGTGTHPSRRPRPQRQATQHWMTDPAVRVCRADNCFNDHPCPRHG